MNSRENDKSFIFNEQIDTQYINDLYGNDYLYVQEVFDTVLKEYETLADNIISSYTSQNIPALKAAIHKIKPIFGFVGLTTVQEQCQHFESVCQHAASIDLLAPEYDDLKTKLIKSKSLIEEEKKKLELFNNQRS